MSKKVLIIDNGGLEYASLPAALGSDYNVIVAEGGEEALSALKRNFKSLSAVVLDLTAAGRDGLEVLNTIRDNALWHQIPVIAASDITDESAQLKAFTCGANAYVTTPLNNQLLKQLIFSTVRLCEISAITNSLRRDKLTGLYNREAFFSEAATMIYHHAPGYYVLACFDIDSFKVINDQHGPDMGDRVLKHIATCINDCVTTIGGIACRFMADIFAVLYPTEYMDSDIIRNNHLKTISPDCLSQPIRIRIGRYTVNDTSMSVSAMYDRAALAADAIRGRYDVYISQYKDSMRDNLLHEQRIVNEMHAALNAGHFEAWLQPQYNHANGALIGSEALVRWRGKDGKLIPPGDFIPAFERNGFIYELDKCMWKQVCNLIVKWLNEGRTVLPVSVNISRRDVYQKDFFSYLTGLLYEFNIPIELFRLEITESAFSESSNAVLSTVNKLIDYGFTVEIDDFGSGYSSLNTLKDVPASILKLDMRFFENTANTKRSGSIIESVVRMAKWLGMSVIAEGVEDREQADYLRSIGCNFIQGYYYAKPMQVADYEGLLEKSLSDARLDTLETVENLDNNAFWDPKSLETLIFNSYVGGACIFEFHNNRVELIRSNNEYNRIFSGYFANKQTTAELKEFEFLDENGQDTVFLNIRNAIETKRESSCEICLSDNNGHSMYLRSTVRLIAQSSDRFMFYCLVTNVSLENENSIKMTELINALPGGVVIYRVGDTIETLYSSDGVLKLTDIDIQEYQEKQQRDIISEFVYEDDIPALREHISERVTNGEQVVTTFRIKHKNGSIVWVLLSASMIREDGDGKVYYGVFTKPPTETALYRSIVEDSSNAIIVFEKNNRKILYANNAWKRLENLPENTIVAGCTLHDLFSKHKLFFNNEHLEKLPMSGFLEKNETSAGGKPINIKARSMVWNGLSAYVCYMSEHKSN